MARKTFVWRDGDWRAPLPRPPRKGPMIISDYIPETRSQIDGRTYDSKSEYYRHVRETGHEIVGNERLSRAEEPVFTEGDVRDAIGQIEAGKGAAPGVAPDTWED